MAHDEQNEAKQGDKVVIAETRPLSARKRFVLEKILERGGVQHVEATNNKPDIEEEKAETVVSAPAKEDA